MSTPRFFVFLSLIGTWLATASPAVAQLNQPIYPVYDGFHQTEGGVYVISYAYFSHNYDVVTVPLGTDNNFELEPSDRLQPTTFRPGHHRFQCVMVMEPNFTGGLQWALSYAGTTTLTSEDMLQYNWELDAGTQRRVLRDIDVTSAPRGVCLNRSPLVRILGLRNGPDGEPPELTAISRAELKLFGSVRDEGLPRGSSVTTEWRVLSGPGNATFSAPNEPRSLVTFDTAGTYELELWASDSALDTSTTVIVHVE